MANHATMKHLLAAAALATLIAGLVSCGASGPGSTLPFDEEPIGGGSSTLTGSLVDATDPSQPISDAYVYIPAGSSSRGASTRAAYARGSVYAWDVTDEDGRYTLENVPDGTQTLYVDPPPGSSYGATRVTLGVEQGADSTLRLALPPADLADRGVNITVAPASKTVEPGETITFEATITDDAGSTLGLTPTWVTTGGIGTIDEDGLFTAGWKEGGGGVFAYVGEEYGEAVVTVAASGSADQSPPEVGLSLSPANGRAPLAVTATATASDPDGSIASVSLDWGDGETFTGTAFPETLTHTYASPGTYQAEASATDDDGLSDYATVDLRVESPDNQSPTCSLSASPATGTIPLDVVFDGSGSDPDGSIATWELDFGDESTVWQSSAAPSGVTHTYSTGGNYTARLTVTDDSGGSANSEVEISANDPAYQNPTATLDATPTTGTAALTVTFNGSGVDNNGGSITEYRLDFQGDGTADWSGTSAPTDLTYTYAAAGTYLPKLTVVDSQGLSDSDSVEIVVDPAPELDLSTSSLDFGDAVTRRTFSIYNQGGGNLNWTASRNVGWISAISPGSGANSASVEVQINRDLMDVGTNTGTVTVTSDGGTRTVTITAIRRTRVRTAMVVQIDTGSTMDLSSIANDATTFPSATVDGDWLEFTPPMSALTGAYNYSLTGVPSGLRLKGAISRNGLVEIGADVSVPSDALAALATSKAKPAGQQVIWTNWQSFSGGALEDKGTASLEPKTVLDYRQTGLSALAAGYYATCAEYGYISSGALADYEALYGRPIGLWNQLGAAVHLLRSYTHYDCVNYDSGRHSYLYEKWNPAPDGTSGALVDSTRKFDPSYSSYDAVMIFAFARADCTMQVYVKAPPTTLADAPDCAGAGGWHLYTSGAPSRLTIDVLNCSTFATGEVTVAQLGGSLSATNVTEIADGQTNPSNSWDNNPAPFSLTIPQGWSTQ